MNGTTSSERSTAGALAARPRWRADAAALGLLVLATVIAFRDVIGGARGLYFRDHILVFKPLWWAGTRQLGAGRWPLLPTGVATTPLEAMTGAAFYTPLSILFGLGRFEVVYDLFVAAHVLVAAMGAFFLARSLGAKPVSACAAAAVYAFGGPTISFENLLVGLQCLAWAPFVCALAIRVARRPTRLDVALLAAFASFELQAALPEVVFLQAVLALGWCATHRPRPRNLVVVAAVLMGGVLLAAVDLGPAIEGLMGTRRAGGFSSAERTGWSLSPLQLLDLIVPSLWALPELVAFNVPSITGISGDPPYLLSIYLGSAVSVAIAGSVAGRRAAWWWVGLALLGLAMSMGSELPLYAWVTSIPGLSSSRYAIKYMVWVAAAAAVLVGLGVDRLGAARRPLLLILAAHVAILLCVALVVRTPEFASWLDVFAVPPSSGAVFERFSKEGVVASALPLISARVIFTLVASGGLLVLVGVLGGLRPQRESALQWAVCAWLTIELAVGAGFSILGADVAEQSPAPGIRTILGTRGQRVFLALPPPIPIADSTTPFEQYVASRGRFGLNAYEGMRRYEPQDLDGLSNPVEIATFDGIHDLAWAGAERVLARAGVRYMTSLQPLAARQVGSIAAGSSTAAYVYALDEARPYVRTSTSIAFVRSVPEGVRAGAALPLETTIVFGAPTEPALTRTSSACRVEASHRVVDAWRIAGHVDATCPAVVTVLEAWRSGWSATTSGAPAATVVVDAGDVGLLIPPGDHDYEIVYEARSADWGRVSAVGWGAWLVLLGSAVVSRRRQRGSKDRGATVV